MLKNLCHTLLDTYIPAVLGTETKVRMKSVSGDKRKALLKIKTHNSTEPTSSSTDVNVLSNPTNISIKLMYYKL